MTWIISIIIGIVVITMIIGGTSTSMINAARNLSDNGYNSTIRLPFESLFSPTSGIVLLSLMAGLVLAIIVVAYTSWKHRR